MAVRLIQIVNPNGRKGWVAETSLTAAVYKQPPSQTKAAGVEKPASKRRRATKKTAAADTTNTTSTASPVSEED